MRFPSKDLSEQYISLSYQDVLQQYVNTGSLIYVLDGYGNVVFSIESSSIGGTIAVGIPISCSWASMSRNAEVADFALLAGDAITATSATFAIGSDFSLLAGDAITATSSSYALSASWAPQFQLESGSLYNITTSFSLSTSYWNSSSIETELSKKQWNIITGSYLPVTASWVENSPFVSGTMSTGSTYPITASNSETSSYTLTASYSIVSISSSNALTASYVQNAFPFYTTSSITYDGPISQIGTASYYLGASLVAQYVFIYDTNGLFSGSVRNFY